MFQDDTTGLRFGNFEVLVKPDGSVNELGRGGFGRTLLARHFVLDTEVALKLIDERHALDEAARARFLKEAREQARLSHPGIARITDCGQVEGQLYYAVELCPGGNIKEFVVKAGPLSVSDTFHLLLQAADALEYSHRRGVVHLDIKPSNLMLVFDEDDRPQVKLIDFGLVQRTAAENAPSGMDGRPLFSAAFASPEQIRSQPTDGRSDIFSLGMTGWFLLTGRNPVEGAADAVIQERLSGGDYEPQLPKQLTGKARAVFARMVKRNPAERYASGAELLADLRACLQGMQPLSGGWQKRQRSGGALADRFMLEKGMQSRQGMIHQAIDREKRQRVKLTLLRSVNVAQTVAQYRKAVEAMRSMEGTGLLKVLEVSEFNEGWAVVEESPQGVSLTEILRSEGAKPLGRYAPLVWQIGTAMDAAFAAGLTSVMLEETIVEVSPEEARRSLDWSVVSLKIPLSPASADGAASQDADETAAGDFTRTTTSSVAGVQLVARWVYFIIGGKNPPPSSLYSMKEYIAVPGLGDAANQILARHLCGQASPPKCEDLLRQLFGADGISWDSVGERIRQTRWGGVLRQSAELMEDIEQAAADAEKMAEACRPLAELAPDAVKECYACVSRVYEASTAARQHQSKISQDGGRSLAAGRAAVAALEDLSGAATMALAKTEAALKNAKAVVEKLQREEQQRERRRKELVASLADAWHRTEAAAKEAREMAEECRRVAPSAGAARQMESLAGQTGSLASQLESLHREAAEAPEDQWGRLETRIPQARQVATDADEMARACRSLLERAKVEEKRREEEAKLRAAVEAEISEIIGRAEQTVA
ncbi:MAG TPA: protein kinase, partial [Verrucomicrobiales bacterium]|nr:protein kinase [Verrucomicrobiales bacterium]